VISNCLDLIGKGFSRFHLGSIGHLANHSKPKIIIHLIDHFKMGDSFINLKSKRFSTPNTSLEKN
jgi:hypothetical protein